MIRPVLDDGAVTAELLERARAADLIKRMGCIIVDEPPADHFFRRIEAARLLSPQPWLGGGCQSRETHVSP